MNINSSQRWLERTPGLDDETFNFWSKLKENYEADVQKRRKNAEALLDEEKIGHLDAIQVVLFVSEILDMLKIHLPSMLYVYDSRIC